MREARVGDLRGVPGHHVDDARRKSGRLEQLHDVVGGEHRGGRRLPDDRVPHERGRRGEVSADRREIEGGHRVDESLERAIVELVPHPVTRDRLFGVELLRVRRVEAPEIRQLARRVDLGLKHGLRLAEHRRRVQRGAPGGREELGRLQEDRGAILPRPVGPFLPGGVRRLDRLRDMLGGRLVPVAQHMLVIVRHHRLRGLSGANLPATDEDRDVDALVRHRLEASLELGRAPANRARRTSPAR